MRLVDIWDIDQNFWTLNPQLKLAFKDVYDGDKAKDKATSSRLMWAVALFTDPKSKFKDLVELEREALIAKDYNIAFSVDSTQHIIDKWKKFLSPAERHLIELEEKLEQRREYIKSVKYTGDTITDLDKAVINTEKLIESLQKCKDLIAEEESEGIVKKGQVESLSEKGEI